MKSVVYISIMPLTEKVERDWYVSALLENGVAVEFWDVTGLLFPGLEFQEALPRDYCVKISDYRHLESLLMTKDQSQTNYVMLINYEGRFNKIYRMLTRFGCELFFFEWGNLPIKDRSGLSGRLGKLFLHPMENMASFVNKVRGTVAKRLKLVKPFDVVFAGGGSSIGIHSRAGRQVPINLCDYDNYLLSKEKPRVVAARYAVFLDINAAFQTDVKIMGWDYLNPQEYARSFNRFFRMLETKYNLEVVIAAHPKSDYDGSYFEGRKMLKGLTPALVKDAEFVISHHSTSISYAILNRKPLLFVYTNEMKKIYAETVVAYIQDFAEYLAQPVVNIDEQSDEDRITIVEPDRVRYELYKYNYLTSRESESRLNRDIVLAELTA